MIPAGTRLSDFNGHRADAPHACLYRLLAPPCGGQDADCARADGVPSASARCAAHSTSICASHRYSNYLPAVTETAQIGDTFDQMALMDRLIVNDGVPKVVDLGFHAFDDFFKIIAEIGL